MRRNRHSLRLTAGINLKCDSYKLPFMDSNHNLQIQILP